MQSRTGTSISKEASIPHFCSRRANSFSVRNFICYLLFCRVMVSIVYVSLGWCTQDQIWFETILIKFSLKSTLSFTWFGVYCEIYCTLFIYHQSIWHLCHATQDWHNMIAVWAWTALGQPAGLPGLPVSQNQRCGPNKCKHGEGHE